MSNFNQLARLRERFVPSTQLIGDQAYAWLTRLVREMALQDWLLFGYHTIMLLLVVMGSGPQRQVSLMRTSAMWLTVTTTFVLVRGNILRERFVGPFIYRVVTVGSLIVSYLMLRGVLATISSASYDAQLYQIDLSVFGIEPTFVADRWISPFATEWFSFFYYSFFYLIGIQVFPFLFFSSGRRFFGEYSLAIFLIYCVGQLTYCLVPGYGPFVYLAGYYHHQFPHGFWYDLSNSLVASGGALKDIFPSMHTAVPATFALLSWRFRRQLPFRYTWPLTAFFAINIIISTIYLRWHYLIDVVAGLALASSAVALVVPLTRWHEERRQRLNLSPNWPRFFV